jgi:hypothetical protein
MLHMAHDVAPVNERGASLLQSLQDLCGVVDASSPRHAAAAAAGVELAAGALKLLPADASPRVFVRCLPQPRAGAAQQQAPRAREERF